MTNEEKVRELRKTALPNSLPDGYGMWLCSNDVDAMDYAFPIDLADYKDFAKHFFELGLKIQKGE